MKEFTNRALAAIFAVSLICGSASIALADRGGHGHGHDSQRGNNSSGQGCVNPAGHTRGRCKSQAGSTSISGTVTGISGNNAIVTLPTNQEVSVNEQYLLNQGRGLRVGQQVTLRGSYQNGVFVVNSGAYNNYSGPYSGATVRGLIVSVNGNSVQIAQGVTMITVNDANAVSRGAINGSLYPGRTITAYGSWNGSIFYANRIQ